MNTIYAFFKLIRWTNLLFIALTQLLFYIFIFLPLFNKYETLKVVLTIFSSLSIASAGYIINDYFDLEIDKINKPYNIIIGIIIHSKWAIFWYFVLNVIGIILTLILIDFHHWSILLINIICVIVLWFYSYRYKRLPLIGNLVTSILTAWTILFILFSLLCNVNSTGLNEMIILKYFLVGIAYSVFAFLISMVREIIKDMEDMEGDEMCDCKTLPILLGVKPAKHYTEIMLITIITILLFILFFMLKIELWIEAGYILIFVISPLIYVHYKIKNAISKNDFSTLSFITKVTILTGIISMIFLNINSFDI
ncbi:geranylgeranylglycerol-phosphate geranylgeranyltransferase [Dyadobacter frigoris]|uniref:Ubiquinone biosynthesis protein UbiA n=1 Tax=Dyadobacter frigoris TaxID=2576211 RepID=A0A4U6CXR6_9BACT|nr:geranylgeranylglycerol-phosphate geranylgeranyltransferase [Dyadobacter frigoris]TKT89609.1 ubiquinone biosynthesis protein UbiA [Dyadobacter frigoris]